MSTGQNPQIIQTRVAEFAALSGVSRLAQTDTLARNAFQKVPMPEPPPKTVIQVPGVSEQPLMRLWRTLRRMNTAVLLPLSASASESGSQSRSLSVFVARHDLSGSITIAECGCDADTDSDPDGLLF